MKYRKAKEKGIDTVLEDLTQLDSGQ